MLKLRPALQYSEGRSKPWSGAKLINCFAEAAEGDKRDEFALMAAPGLEEWAEVGVGPIRGSHVMAGTLYVVSGTELYSVDRFGTDTLIDSVLGSGLAPGASFAS